MLADDILQVEHIHEIEVTDAVHVNQYYHVIGRNRDSNTVELWLFADDLIEKMDVRPVAVEDILFLDQDQPVISAYVVNNHVLSIETISDYLYYNHQILCTMGDIFQFTVMDNYHSNWSNNQ